MLKQRTLYSDDEVGLFRRESIATPSSIWRHTRPATPSPSRQIFARMVVSTWRHRYPVRGSPLRQGSWSPCFLEPRTWWHPSSPFSRPCVGKLSTVGRLPTHWL